MPKRKRALREPTIGEERKSSLLGALKQPDLNALEFVGLLFPGTWIGLGSGGNRGNSEIGRGSSGWNGSTCGGV